MKKLLLLSIASAISIYSVAQIPRYDTGIINTNAVSALYTADGTQSFKNTGLPAYYVPQDSLQSTIYCGALWVGGFDVGHNLHIAGQTYHQNGTDFWPGPIMTTYSTHEDTVWNHVWIVLKSTVDSFREGKFGHIIPPSIANWPGNGSVALGEMGTLAPYVDSDHNGTYDPSGGDYPAIRGDEALYIIFNDARNTHTETGGLPLGIEVHEMAYQFKNTDTAINSATFLHYDIYNLSANNYDSVYLGNWMDMDVGNGADNFVGCDSAGSYWFTYCGHAYNADGSGANTGEKGYHSLPPAQSVAYMCDTMTHFMAYNNDATGLGNPATAFEYYDYLRNIWRDSTHSTYGGHGHGGSTLTNYMFSGNVSPVTGWSEVSAADPSGDRRGVSSDGPFTINSKEVKSLDLALVFAQSFPGNNLGSVNLLKPYVSRVQTFYNAQSYTCNKSLTGDPTVNSVAKADNSVLAYPNPASTEITFKISSGENQFIRISDITGRELSSSLIYNNQVQINVSAYASGIYIYEVFDKSGNAVNRGKFSVVK
jgi:hypothetical protein